MNKDIGVICLHCKGTVEATKLTKAGNVFLCPICGHDICKEKKVCQKLT